MNPTESQQGTEAHLTACSNGGDPNLARGEVQYGTAGRCAQFMWRQLCASGSEPPNYWNFERGLPYWYPTKWGRSPCSLWGTHRSPCCEPRPPIGFRTFTGTRVFSAAEIQTELAHARLRAIGLSPFSRGMIPVDLFPQNAIYRPGRFS